MIISHSRRFVFIHVHKAGGTSIELGLDPHLSWNDLVLGSTPVGAAMNAPYRTRYGLNKHSSLEEISAVVGADFLRDLYVFGLVREPIARLCSLFNFVGSIVEKHAAELGVTRRELSDRLESDPDLWQRYPGLAYPTTQAFLETADFSEFLRSERAATDRSFRSQASCLGRLCKGAPMVEAFKLEALPGELSTIQRRLGIEFHLPHANRSKCTLVSPEEVSKSDKGFIERLFAVDYEAFGY